MTIHKKAENKFIHRYSISFIGETALFYINVLARLKIAEHAWELLAFLVSQSWYLEMKRQVLTQRLCLAFIDLIFT